MKNKTGNKTQGKSASGTRMSIVLRFLAGTQPEEIQIFLDLLFEPVKHFRNGSCRLPDTLIRVVCCRLLMSQAGFPTLPHLSEGTASPSLGGGLFCRNAIHFKLGLN